MENEIDFISVKKELDKNIKSFLRNNEIDGEEKKQIFDEIKLLNNLIRLYTSKSNTKNKIKKEK